MFSIVGFSNPSMSLRYVWSRIFRSGFIAALMCRVIINPADLRIDIALDRNFDLKTVSVHPPAFVALRRFGQSLRRFKSEIFRQARAHNQTPRCVGLQMNLCI